MQSDDLPWPELGNVSRGATRGNQGQKGALGPPDAEGRCVLQLRVQPGVLAVKLNRRSSDWYRTLDNEVNRALKLTKTYWRKARRRQDYDARADQDHMELHEWLQQLKDKTMSHLEVLMQKGDIQGPPYVMPDEIELAFLRKFIERHNAGIPHNPRLRHLGVNAPQLPHIDDSMELSTPELSEGSYPPSSLVDHIARLQPENGSNVSSPNYVQSPGTSRPHIIRTCSSPSTAPYEQLLQDAQSSGQYLQEARVTLARAQSQTQDAFQRYTACLEAEARARRDVNTAEQHRDELMTVLLSRTQSSAGNTCLFGTFIFYVLTVLLSLQDYSRQSSLPHDDSSSQQEHPYSSHHLVDRRPSADMVPSQNSPRVDWRQPDMTGSFAGALEAIPQSEMRSSRDPSYRPERKHSRSWEEGGQVDVHNFQDSNLPPRKRLHHIVDPCGHSAPLISQAIALPL
ncbi:uncharacterized protein EDB91DRAFT_481605 [Suillus paluster]|uniref:uncharacterized protein n=1 Tax=Suillus paluster TaxID=48578 RepID=UPI001B87EB90|nr:uncharacterized protein EDB91DRAFT_481605 [Suillus paluster]KAG1737527.1 hypothetical protein EDB91DRAFT_481605 [Suillus paluster]